VSKSWKLAKTFPFRCLRMLTLSFKGFEAIFTQLPERNNLFLGEIDTYHISRLKHQPPILYNLFTSLTGTLTSIEFNRKHTNSAFDVDPSSKFEIELQFIRALISNFNLPEL